MAKNIAKLFTQWRLAYLKKRLKNLVQSLINLQSNCQDHFLHRENQELLRRSLNAWRHLPQFQDEKSQNFSLIREHVGHYNLFRAWRDISWNIKVQDNIKIIKLRERAILRAWRSSLSDIYEMKGKARSYHKQALSSKALLMLYVHAQERSKVKRFQRKLVFKKFFKRAWKSQFARHRHLRTVLKMISKKEAEWERTRYQREFNHILKAFETWRGRVHERRKLIQNYNALSQYRSSLLIKHFSRWKKIVRIKHGLRRLGVHVARQCYRPAVERLLELTLRS